jgi:hypothetical protein
VFWNQFVRLTISLMTSLELYSIVPFSITLIDQRQPLRGWDSTDLTSMSLMPTSDGQRLERPGRFTIIRTDGQIIRGLNCAGLTGHTLRHCASAPSKGENASRRSRKVRFHPKYPAEAGSPARGRGRPRAGQGTVRERRLRRRPEGARLYQTRDTLPFTPGSEFAGIVGETATDVSGVKASQRTRDI